MITHARRAIVSVATLSEQPWVNSRERRGLDFVLALEPHNRLEERNQTRAYASLLLRTKPRWARLYGQFPGVRSLRQPQMRPLDLPNPLPLRGQTLDDGFTDLARDADGRAHFSIEAGGKKVETLFGPRYSVATIWLPADPAGKPREFICFEPLTTIINGIHLAQEGKWRGLQSLPAGEKWTESFWVRTEGI